MKDNGLKQIRENNIPMDETQRKQTNRTIIKMPETKCTRDIN